MTPKILVPVDFTNNAFNAYRYANNLAFSLRYNLLLVHVVAGSLTSSDRHATTEGGSLDEMEDKLKSFANWHPNAEALEFFAVDTFTKVVVGDPVRSVVDLSEEEDIAYIVCGTREKHGVGDRWLGTVSSGIASRASAPTMLIPTNANFNSFKSIVIACGEEEVSMNLLNVVSEMKSVENARLHLVHVVPNVGQERDKTTTSMLSKLQMHDPSASIFELKTLEGRVVDELRVYVVKVGADLLVLQASRKSTLRKLLTGSVSREIALSAPIPILMVH